MKSLTDMLYWAVGVIAFAWAIWELIVFVTFKDAQGHADMIGGLNHLWWSILGIVITCACAVGLFMRHPRHVEEIHVTK